MKLEEFSRRMAISEERDRIADERFDRIEGKLDTLIAALNMGKGAWMVIVKAGGILVLVAGAFGWLADHFKWWTK